MSALIPIGEHESNLDKTAKLEWPLGKVCRGAVYSVRKGFVAILDDMAFPGHFSTLSEAKAAVGAA
ncbi:hypothetical protein [Aliirhizobium cellulosilyticum]|uniref:Uncharacterized protein n=1 Tax=Aliirhizobium cellulosilyticum TaxID=393664 RepID=A0A7W6UTX5_9HYPH|nr:hypothetical protein [Rhizobium cellulosilyticum]MBB4347982.1 hypothetical protein [Rhizobium cellulosilyticum]MBB4409624.1 hypothetical protein [Rhizobium cellulosilyticum]MBB4444312.1 hypothetical protein [Rhizobium cellulosilyticum]